MGPDTTQENYPIQGGKLGATIRERSPVENELQIQEDLLQGLEKAAVHLSVKLQPIMTMTDEAKALSEPELEQGNSEVVGKIRRNNYSIRQTIDAIDQFTRNLEV